jgi:hypothetical protein
LAGSLATGPAPAEIVLADDRPLTDCGPLPVTVPERLRPLTKTVYSCGSGPAAARNAGWRETSAPWTVFLDDDVLPSPAWAADLARDLAAADPGTAGVQGRIEVPLPRDRRPTDWERNTAGLATAPWITADMAFRRDALESAGGFDPAFPRAFREDADLALRLQDGGWTLRRGTRLTTHPVRPANWLASVKAQAGNADDVLMVRRHGAQWWERAEAPRGRFHRHVLLTAAGLGALGLALTGHRRAALGSAAVWLAGTAEFAAARILPGPRTGREITTMLATSALIPPAACAHAARGRWRHRAAQPAAPRRAEARSPERSLEAVTG